MATLTNEERTKLETLLAKAEAAYEASVGEQETTSFSHSNGAAGRSMSLSPLDMARLERDITRWRAALGLSPSLLFDSPARRPIAVALC